MASMNSLRAAAAAASTASSSRALTVAGFSQSTALPAASAAIA